MEEKVPVNKTNLIIMVLLIIMLLVGILVRRNQIKVELGETFEFYKERMQYNDSI
ncbi:MAG: hypothetical protein R3Y26_01455 [Rikenellaceae bacterium]